MPRRKKRTRRNQEQIQTDTISMVRKQCRKQKFTAKEIALVLENVNTDATKHGWSKVYYHIKFIIDKGSMLSKPLVKDATYDKYGFNKPPINKGIGGPDYPGCINSGMNWMLARTKSGYFVCKVYITWYTNSLWWRANQELESGKRSFTVEIDRQRKRFETVKCFKSYASAANLFKKLNDEIRQEHVKRKEERAELLEKAKSGNPEDMTNLAFDMLDNG